MIETFLATINPMLTLFICIVLGFVLTKLKLLPENASKVMAKLETYAFCPALSFYTMASQTPAAAGTANQPYSAFLARFET